MLNRLLCHLRVRMPQFLLLICMLLLAATSGTSQALAKIQRTQLAPEPILGYTLSSDSQWVVYQVRSGVSPEGAIPGPVYSQRLSGGERMKLSDAAYTVDLDISPDNQRVLIHEHYPSMKGLQIVPIEGGTLLSLSQPDQYIPQRMYKFSPDGQWVVYPIKPIDSNGLEGTLYSVPVTGGASILLGDTYIYSGAFDNYYLQFSADSRYVVTIDPVSDVVYRVPIGGGTKANLSPLITLDSGDIDVKVFGDTVVYKSASTMTTGPTYYSASISTGVFHQLAQFPSGYGSQVTGMTLSADGLWGIFQIGHRAAGQFEEWVQELYSAKLDGSTLVKLGESPVGGRIDGIITPDSTQVVVTLATGGYWTSTGPMSIVPIGGGAARQLAGSVMWTYGFTKDSSQVIFQYPINLASVGLAGGPAKILNITPSAGQKIVWTLISPDKQWVLYSLGTGEGDPPRMDSLYSIPINGGVSRRLDNALMSSPGYFNFQFTPDSLKIVFTSSAGEVGSDYLFVVRDAPQLLRGGDGTVFHSYQPLLGRN